MPNTSASGGYLTPGVAPAPLEDDLFDTFLHDLFAGLSGLPGDMVRPSWQPEPPNQPAFGVDWLAFGIRRQDPDTYAVTLHDPASGGADSLQRHETVEIMLSSYGNNASKNLATLRDGLQIEQNRAVLTAAAMGLVQTGEIITAPALIKDRWTRRFDMSVTIRRQILRTYPVLTIESTTITIDNEKFTETVNVVNPPAP